MTYEEMADKREELIAQGVLLPNLDDEYHNHDDQFDKFSCVTGDYRATSSISDADNMCTIKVESDIDSDTETLHYSDTETICQSDTDSSSRFEFSTASTPSTRISQFPDGNTPVVYDPVHVNNEHEGMTYDLLADGPEIYDYQETIVQTGN